MTKLEVLHSIDNINNELRQNKNHPNKTLINAYLKGARAALKAGLVDRSYEDVMMAGFFLSQTHKTFKPEGTIGDAIIYG